MAPAALALHARQHAFPVAVHHGEAHEQQVARLGAQDASVEQTGELVLSVGVCSMSGLFLTQKSRLGVSATCMARAAVSLADCSRG